MGSTAAEIGAGIDQAVTVFEEFAPWIASAVSLFNPVAGHIVVDIEQAAPAIEAAFAQVTTSIGNGLSNIDSLAAVGAIFRNIGSALTHASVAGQVVASTATTQVQPPAPSPASPSGAGTAGG